MSAEKDGDVTAKSFIPAAGPGFRRRRSSSDLPPQHQASDARKVRAPA